MKKTTDYTDYTDYKKIREIGEICGFLFFHSLRAMAGHHEELL